MRFIATADTDIGISKSTNQDSLLIKHGMANEKEILMAIVCDGMGGLAKGELASATVIREFSKWFDNQLPYELSDLAFNIIAAKWNLLLKELNSQILEYGSSRRVTMGTTFTGILFVDDMYMVAHVGDSRLYSINNGIQQLTEDHTFIAREIRKGTITQEQAKTDKRRNMLLQCIGASDKVEPQVFTAQAQRGVYMLCSDGFRHTLSSQELYNALHPTQLVDKNVMHSTSKYLIDLIKKRGEKDNISVILIKAE
ncbi:Serine/threonine protein phosphatase PrpC [Lachnospiraceae bacterium NE2001]|nr:Serine/threonine protein phosphatase PrpC [Lachnospiraceae bacterium NE2001]